MANRLIAACGVLVLLILASPREAAACETCKLAGFVCSAYDDCNEVFTCQDVNFGHAGSNDCFVDYYGCYTGGGLCQWASQNSSMEKIQVWAPTCHETNS